MYSVLSYRHTFLFHILSSVFYIRTPVPLLITYPLFSVDVPSSLHTPLLDEIIDIYWRAEKMKSIIMHSAT